MASTMIGQPAAGISCHHCGQPNEENLRFCGHCGKNLWAQCPGCEETHRIGLRFCGQCGMNLQMVVDQKAAQYQEMLDEATVMLKEHDLRRALSHLDSLVRVQDKQFQRYTERATELIAEIQTEKEHWDRVAISAMQTATQALARHDYDVAVKALSEIPVPLRNEEQNKLLKTAASQQREVGTLSSEIQLAIKTGQMQGLGQRVDRLLQLQPETESVQRLAVQLRDRLFGKAHAKFRDHDFTSTLRLLDEVPYSERNENVEKLHRMARERQWLQIDLRLSPVVDKHLVGIAERFAKVCPDDESAQDLLRRVKAKVSEKKPDHRSAAPGWVLPEDYRFGFPVVWLGGFETIQTAQSEKAMIGRLPGQFFVAAGLAIQGMGAASIDTNFVPEKQSGLLKSWPFQRKKTARAAWGVDVGTSAIKAVRLTRESETSPLRIDQVRYVQHESPLTASGSPVGKVQQILRASLNEFSKTVDFDDEPIVVGLSGRHVLGRFFNVPAFDKENVDSAVKFEIKHQLPMALDDLYWATHLFDRGQGNDEFIPQQVMLQATKRQFVDELLEACQAEKLRVSAVQSEPVALHNFARFEFAGLHGPETPSSSAAIALLDIGTHSTNFVISSPNQIWFRNLNVGGDTFNRALLRPFQLTHEEAETLKREPLRTKSMHKLYDEFEAIFAMTVAEIERSIQNFQSAFPKLEIKGMYGFGGGFQLHGMMRHLCRKF